MLRAAHARRQPALRPPRRHLVGRRLLLSLLRTSINPARSATCAASWPRSSASTRGARRRSTSAAAAACWRRSSPRLGCRVTGVDPSTESLETARAHADAEGLAIDYRSGRRAASFRGRAASTSPTAATCSSTSNDLQRPERDGPGPETRRRLHVRHDQSHSPQPAGLDQALAGVAVDRADGAEPPRLGHVHQAGGARGRDGRGRARRPRHGRTGPGSNPIAMLRTCAAARAAT